MACTEGAEIKGVDRGLKRSETTASERGDDLKAIASSEAQPRPSGSTGKKRIRRRRLKQEVIDAILKEPFSSLPAIPEDRLAKRSEEFRKRYYSKKAITDGIIAYEADIIEQYRAKGYAEVEEEIADNDDKLEN